MIDKIKTILNSKFSIFSKNDATSMQNFVKIKEALHVNFDTIETEEELIRTTIKNMLNISSDYSIKFDFYQQRFDQDHLWKSLIDGKEWKIEESEKKNGDKNVLISKGLYHKKSTSENTVLIEEMVRINLSDSQQYLFEMFDRGKYTFYYFLLITQFEYLIHSYRQKKETQKYMFAKEQNENKLIESKQQVTAAQKAMKRKVYELHNLVEASNEIYSILDFKQLIHSALLTIIGQIGFQKAFMLMYDSEKHDFRKIFQKGFGNAHLEDATFEINSPQVSFFLKHRTPMYISRIEKHNDLKRFADELKNRGIFVVAPLIYSERLQGIVCAGEKLHSKDFSESDFEMFHILINIISISIGNSNLFQEMKNLSLTDGMTNLHNYRYFQDRLNEEINRAKRHGKKVSLMILDIDHFKNYNDTLGHQAGDTVLRTMGKLLKSIIRDEDIVARYGGEEFCIILPGIQKDGISSLGERVRAKVESEPFYKEEVQPGGKVTISLGIATFPDDAQDFTNLVKKADQALYKAKNLGRNQISVYQEI